MSKRRKGFPPEPQVKHGVRVVHGDKGLVEKVGRNDLIGPQPHGEVERKRPRTLHPGALA